MFFIKKSPINSFSGPCLIFHSLVLLSSFYEAYNKQQDDGADGGTDNISNREAAWDHSGEEPAGDEGAQDTDDDVS